VVIEAGGRERCRRPHLCFITTLPYQVNVFLAEHVQNLLAGADVSIITNGKRQELLPVLRDRVHHHHVAIERPIRPAADLAALTQVTRILGAMRPDLVQTMTPKAGLVGMLAARIAGVQERVHWFTGQVWQTATNPMRFMLRNSDRLTASLATALLVDSPSQRTFLADNRIAPEHRMTVLGKGSVRGVDAARFRPNPAFHEELRRNLGIGPSETLALFVGRLTKDKGLLDLAAAMRELRGAMPGLHVALLGFEEGAFIGTMQAAAGSATDRLHFLGFSDDPERFMAAADFLVLPSHREGFGSTVIEAAACGIPAIGTCIHGLTDAIVDGETGILVPPRDPLALGRAMRELSSNDSLRGRFGAAAMERARREFSTDVLTAELRAFYGRLIGAEFA